MFHHLMETLHANIVLIAGEWKNEVDTLSVLKKLIEMKNKNNSMIESTNWEYIYKKVQA